MLDIIVVILYLFGIVFIGTVAGKFSTTTSDFFFGGQRFTWWLVGMSCVATLVGSYSFIQYSEVGYSHGMPSLGPYTNEWFVLPIFLGAWLPIFYYNRLESVPEYFEKRFSWGVRQVVIGFLLLYLIGYVGVNLLTIGVALKGIMANDPQLASALGFEALKSLPFYSETVDYQIIVPAILVAVLSAIYLHSGGQTSVIITDLVQGFLLLFVGLGVVGLGIHSLGGFEPFFSGLPDGHKFPFAHFNDPPKFHFVGDFWNDAAVGSFAFYIINQGILMRFLSARSVTDGRKAMVFVALFMMPLAAISVGGAGWVGKALETHGYVTVGDPKEAFITVAKFVTLPGVYGMVVAAVVAALMSTLDTLITAICAVVVNDIIRPRVPGQSDEYYLKIAKQAAVVVTVFGLCLIPVFNQFASIYQALSHFTSILIPPLIIVVIFGVFVRKFSATGALWTLILGGVAVQMSVWFPQLITPIAHGVDPSENYSFMRALYGLLSTSIIATIMTFLAPERDMEKLAGLTAYDLDTALFRFKGSDPNFEKSGARVELDVCQSLPEGDGDNIRLPRSALDELALKPGDMIYVTDTRWWWGGLRSVHARVAETEAEGDKVEMTESMFQRGGFYPDLKLAVEKVF